MNKGIPPRSVEFDTEQEFKFAMCCWLIFFSCYAYLVLLATGVFYQQWDHSQDVEIQSTSHLDFPSIKIDVCETTHFEETLLDRLDAQMYEWTVYPDESKTREVTMKHAPRYYEMEDFRCLRFDTHDVIETTAVLVHSQLHMRIVENETHKIPESRLSFGPAWQSLLQNGSRLANGFYMRLSLAEDEQCAYAFDNEEMVPRLIPSTDSRLNLVMPAFGKVHKSIWRDDLPDGWKSLFGAPPKKPDTFWFETSEFQTMAGSTKGGDKSQHIRSDYPLILDVEVLDTNVHMVQYMNTALENTLSFLGKVASYTIIFGAMGFLFPFKVPIIRRSRIPILAMLDVEDPGESDPLIPKDPFKKEATNTWEAC